MTLCRLTTWSKIILLRYLSNLSFSTHLIVNLTTTSSVVCYLFLRPSAIGAIITSANFSLAILVCITIVN